MKREFSTAAAWSAAAAWMEQAAAALIFLVIARIIGVESFGIASMAFAFLFLGEFLVRDTITEAIIERETLEDGRLEATFFALTGVAFAIMVALIGVAQLVAHLYGQPSVAPLLTTVSPAVLMIGLGGVSTALLRRRMEYKTLAIRTIVGVTVGGLVGIAMALNGYGAWSLVGQRLAELGLNSVLAILGARWWPRRLPSRAELGLIRGLGPRVLKLRTWTLVVNQTPTVMLGIFADPRAAGLFAFSARLIEIVIKVSVRVIQGVAQSAIAELRRKTGRTSGFFLDLTELSAFAGFVSLTGLAMVAFPLTRVLLGPEWDTAGQIIPFLCVAGAAMALTATQEAYLLALDRVDGYLGVIAIEAVLGVILIGFASSFGAVAAAAAVALRAMLVLPFCTRAALAPEAIPARGFVHALASPAIVAVAMGLVVALWRLFALGRIGDITYLALAVLIGMAMALIAVVGFMPATFARLKSYVRA